MSTSPRPAPGEGPAAYRGPSAAPGGRWQAPQAGRAGEVTVDRSVLRSVGSALSADLRELDQAVNRLLGSGRGAGSIAGWATADAFSANADNAFTGVMQASSQVADAHQVAARKLADSAASYDGAEGASRHAVASIAAQLNAVTGSVSAAGQRMSPDGW
jgi:hypothetical protein